MDAAKLSTHSSEVQMDATFSPALLNFSATSVEVRANSAKALALFADLFGRGAVSAVMPKSEALRFADFLAAKGLSQEVAA
jgi:hypothetical protein